MLPLLRERGRSSPSRSAERKQPFVIACICLTFSYLCLNSNLLAPLFPTFPTCFSIFPPRQMTPVPLLPQELLLLQLQALELVESLFPLPGEVLISSASCATRRWIEAGGEAADKHGRDRLRAEGNWEDELRLTVNVRLLEDEDEGERTFTLALSVSIPLCQVDDGRPTTPDGAPYAFLSLQQPPWLSRAAHDSLSAFLPSSQPDSNLAEYGSNAELVLQTIEVVKEEGAKLVPKKEEEVVVEEEEVPEFRVWCWVRLISFSSPCLQD